MSRRVSRKLARPLVRQLRLGERLRVVTERKPRARERGVGQRVPGIRRDGALEELPRGVVLEDAQLRQALRVEPRAVGVCGKHRLHGRGLLHGDRGKIQLLAQAGARARDERVELRAGSLLGDRGDRLALRRVLQTEVEPDGGAGLLAENEVGAQQHDVGADVLLDPAERVLRQGVRIGERQVDSHPRDALARHGAQLLAGGQLRRQHLGERDRHPRVGGPAGEVAEPEHRDRAARGADGGRGRRPRGVPGAKTGEDQPGRRGDDHGGRGDHEPAAASPGGAGARRDLLAAQCARDVERGRKPVGGITLEAPQDGAVPRGRQLRRRSPRRGRRLLELLERDGQRRVAVERLRAGDHLVEDDAEGVDVGRSRQGAALDLLGRHVVRRPEHGLRLRQRRPAGRLRAAREAEIRDDDPNAARPPLVRREHDVAALEVAVDHAGVVRGREGRGHLLDQRQRLRRRHLSGALEALGQRLAGEQLHREESEILVVEDVVDPAHVRVCHGAREVDLPQEPVHRPRIAGDLRADRLQRDPLVEDLVLGLVDLAHAAARDEAHDAESSREDLVDRDARAARAAAARHDRRLIPGTGLGQGVEPPERPE